MSKYIAAHPEEAYLDEVKVVMYTCKRRYTWKLIRCILLMKVYVVYLYRCWRLYETDKRKFPR